jgi:hypothetical protein
MPSTSACVAAAPAAAAAARTLWVDPAYAGAASSGNASHPFKTLAAAWAALPKAPAKLSAGVTIMLKPVSGDDLQVLTVSGFNSPAF